MQFNKTLLAVTILTVGGFATISSANADSTESTFGVETTIDASCTIDTTAANISFSTIAAGTALQDASITDQKSGTGILVKCSKDAPYIINLKAASNPDGTDGKGTMKGVLTDNTDTINYQLNAKIEDAITPWGNLETNGVTGTGAGVSTSISHIVYATIESTTDVKEDTYKDVITASITY
ncbi:spore coat protein U domain-containing protein [Psychrobacter sp. 28M-43]|uniref:spore coat protein U domain-containing protein n=1 Tax=Psychrobacter sp. 28M-43 TaxID=2772254 RepID=UPI00168D2EC7|nr:spore coat protein U domain-containing protein [Psychrobacter sp. 28M-43]QOD13554.1 spore coat protein U domain-containing protein [Psychrobacter sp. 28M-43]